MLQRKQAAAVTVRVGPLVNLAQLIHSLGREPGPIFERHGFELEEFEDPDHKLPFLRAARLLEDAAKTTHCAHFGLLLAEQADVSMLGVAGFLVRTAPTVKQAIRSLIENLDLQDESSSIQMSSDANFVTLVYTINVQASPAAEHIYDLSIAVMYRIIHTICGGKPITTAVKLMRPAPLDLRPYRALFHSSLFFNSTECSVSFPLRCLEWEPPAADKWLYRHLQQEALELHDRYNRELLDELPTVLRKGLLTGRIKAREIADVFGVGERTFHRRLRASGTSFRQELDRARQSASEELLSTTSLPIHDLAQALGYSGSSGFIRAFQRWSGTSPSHWRKQNSQREVT